jgi:hypothetical protein
MREIRLELEGVYNMSRKHFIVVAETLKTQNASAELCRELAYEFKKINPNFCIYKFLTACGI